MSSDVTPEPDDAEGVEAPGFESETLKHLRLANFNLADDVDFGYKSISHDRSFLLKDGFG
jgi:hypothetical protein